MKNEQLNVDLSKTTPIQDSNGDQIFTQAVVLRKVSKFLLGSSEDAIIPVVCFISNKTGKIFTELLPKELREEYTKLQEDGKTI